MEKRILFLDNTRIGTMKACPMQYLIRHKLGWVRDTDAPALCFGGAWHEGKAAIFRLVKEGREQSISPDEKFWTMIYEESFLAFMGEWIERGMPAESNLEDMESLYPRVPGVAKEMLFNYIQIYKDWLWHDIEILDIEKPFMVPLQTFQQNDQEVEVYLIGRRDITYKDYSGIWAMEHKTTTLGCSEKLMAQGHIFQHRFLNGFNMSPQVAGYTYSLRLEFGEEESKGVMISGDLVHKKFHDKFQKIPLYKSEEYLESWYNDTCFWVERILAHEGTDFWPHNESSCNHQYGPCSCKEICEVIADPRKLPSVYNGYKVEFWQPFDEEALLKILKEKSE